ncbi:MAG: SAM-dependent methyltransferase, partial [Patescibacteria group bacterium]
GIYLFLLPNFLKRLGPELERRLRAGTIVVSAEFAIPGWTPIKTFEARGVTKLHAPIYVYRIAERHLEKGR